MVTDTQHHRDGEEQSLEMRHKRFAIKQVNKRNLFLFLLGLTLVLSLIVFISSWRERKYVSKEIYKSPTIGKPDPLNSLPKSYAGLKKASQTDETAQTRTTAKQTDLGRAQLNKQDQTARRSPIFFRISNASKPSRKGELDRTAVSSLASKLSNSQKPSNALTFQTPNTETQDQNKQQEKRNFLKQKQDHTIYNSFAQQKPLSPYQVMAGTLMSAALITGLNSDLPGQVLAQVTEPVYDTVTGRHLLIPQGTKIIGRYDSVIAFGQSRALVIWQRLILPDGTSIKINNLPAVDTRGYTGLEDEVDFQTWRLIKGIVLSSLLNIGSNISLGQDDGDLLQILRVSSTLSEAGDKIVSRNLDRQPTLKIRPGWPLRIMVNQDLILRPFVQSAP